jgi:flagellar biosynthesis/type III secretory pathway chaperone
MTTRTQRERLYAVLMQVIEAVMVRSRNALNTTQLVEASYGDDAAVFGGKDMLAGTMDDMLDTLHDQVLQQDLRAYLQNHGIEALLDRFESIFETLDTEDAARAKAELDDKESAGQAIDVSLLPPGVTLEDAVDYNNYQHALKQKEQMMKALQEVQEEIATLEKEQAEMSSHVESKQRVLQQTAQELNRSADVCSMVVSS